MLDLINNQFLDLEQRKEILKRAMNTQPFFNLLDFEVDPSGVAGREQQYAAKASVDKDYWITEVKSNISAAEEVSGSLFDLSLWISNTGDSLFRYIKSDLLPHQVQATNAVEPNSIIADRKNQDWQREIFPRIIRRGNNISASVRNKNLKSSPTNIQIVTSGYYTGINGYIPQRAIEGVNESLAKPIEYEIFSVNDIGTNGVENQIVNQNKIVGNDRFARLILGFSVRDKISSGDPNSSQGASSVTITDNYRSLRFNNLPIPIQFLAPRMIGTPLIGTQDAHIYYLPLEYFWQPFASLKFEFVNLNGGGAMDYDLYIHTRTV